MYKSRAKNAQEAHEAIRPTKPWLTPDQLPAHISSDQRKLYRLIWERTLASQMTNAVIEQVRGARPLYATRAPYAQGFNPSLYFPWLKLHRPRLQPWLLFSLVQATSPKALKPLLSLASTFPGSSFIAQGFSPGFYFFWLKLNPR